MTIPTRRRQVTLRGIFAATLFVAIIASLIPTDGIWLAAVPPIIWGAAVSIGLLYSHGRRQACFVYSGIAGSAGAAAATVFIMFSPYMSFGASWAGPITTIAVGGLGGCVVAIPVRLVMEGLAFRRLKTSD